MNVSRKSRARQVTTNALNPLRKQAKSRKTKAKPNTPSHTLAIVGSLLRWFDKYARDLPWRRTSDPYAIWISEIMLQQTQVKTVIPYWERWMRTLPGISSLAKARVEKLLKLWEGLGYYTRVHNAQKAALLIMQKHGGRFPRVFEQVLELPGIGRYTAGAICSIAFNQPTPILDGNVSRVLHRCFGITGDPKSTLVKGKLWALAAQLVQCASNSVTLPGTDGSTRLPGIQSACSAFNQAMMELGALVCTPASPNCQACPLASFCAVRNGKHRHHDQSPSRQAPIKRKVTAFVVRKANKILVRQRPRGVVNALLWEFPSLEEPSHGQPAKVFRRLNKEPLCRIQHSITRYRITLEVFEADLLCDYYSSLGVFKTIRELKMLPFASAHKKVLLQLAG